MKKFITMLLPALQVIYCQSQTCLLDPSFGVGGKAIGYTYANIGHPPLSNNMIVQTDGKIIQFGFVYTDSNYDFAVVRYKSNGSVDSAFGVNGKAIIPIGSNDDITYFGELQSNGKIVVAGSSVQSGKTDFAVIRLNSTGSLDTTFGINGKVTTTLGTQTDVAQSIATQTDGKIVVTGSTNHLDTVGCLYYVPQSAVVRYNINGSIDSTFGENGKIIFGFGQGDMATVIALQPDGKILVGCSTSDSCSCDEESLGCNINFFTLLRFKSNGSLDSTFGSNGKVIDSSMIRYPSSMVLQTDGKIVISGIGSAPGLILERFSADGSLDNNFSGDGIVTSEIPFIGYSNALFIQPDGKILIAVRDAGDGISNNFAVVRFNSNGYLDSAFNGNGKASFHVGSSGSTDGATGIGIQGTKILVGGYSYIPNFNEPRPGSLLVTRIRESFITLSIAITPGGPTTFCEGANVRLYSGITGTLQWYKSNIPIPGATDTAYTATTSGSYSVSVINDIGCGKSDSVVVTVNTIPPQPPINWNGTVFSTTSGYVQYRWYVNGSFITNTTANTYQPLQPGLYKVEVVTAGHCTNTSTEFNLVVTAVGDIILGDDKLRYYPNPARTVLYVDIPYLRNSKLESELFDQAGKLIKKQSLNQLHNQLYIEKFAPGIYHMVIYNRTDKIAVKVLVIK